MAGPTGAPTNGGPTGGAGPTGPSEPNPGRPGTVTTGVGPNGQPIVTGVNQPGGSPIPSGALAPQQGVQAPPAAPKPPAPNGLAQFANSALGQYLSSQGGGQSPATAQNYLNAFQGALGGARADISQQLAGALSDIKANQAYAQQALGQLPGQINQSYGTANQLMNTGQHVAQQGMNAPGLNAATGSNTGGSLAQYMAPERAAIAGEKAGEMANVPLLATGIQQAGSQEAAAANNAALSDYGSLAQQQAQLAGQAQIAAMGQQSSLTQQQQQNQYGLVNNALQNQYTLSQIKASNANAPYSGLSTTTVQQAMSSPSYQQAARAIASGNITTRTDLLKQYGSNPVVAQVLISQYGLK